MKGKTVSNLDAIISMDDAQNVQKLALIFMDSLHLNVKHSINANL